jgi:hypothetical protein
MYISDNICRYCKNLGGIPPDSDWKQPLIFPPCVDAPWYSKHRLGQGAEKSHGLEKS